MKRGEYPSHAHIPAVLTKMYTRQLYDICTIVNIGLELEQRLPGWGPIKKNKKIHNDFISWEDIMEVKGTNSKLTSYVNLNIWGIS